MAEHVILFTGPMGAGKTTAIEKLSEIDVVRTEAANTDRQTADKATTTVALDYGEIVLDDEDKVRLYGIPGQRRFDFMWAILKERAKGMVLLVHNDAEDPLGRAVEYLEEFGDLYAKGGVVIGITRTDLVAGPSIADYAAALAVSHPDKIVPIYTVDPRNPEQMRTLLMTLVANIETRDLFVERAAPVGSAAQHEELVSE